MEYFVNLDPRDAPTDLVAIQFEIPDQVTTERIAIDKLQIPQETNLLINPDHPDLSKLIFQPPSEFLSIPDCGSNSH